MKLELDELLKSYGERAKLLPLDFYNFSNALIGIFSLLYEERLKGRETLVNLTTAPHSTSIAAIYASKLTSSVPFLFLTDAFKETAISSEIIKEVSLSSIFPILDFYIPNEFEGAILKVLSKSSKRNVSEILLDLGIKTNRSNSIKCARHIENLRMRDMVERRWLGVKDFLFHLTESGQIVIKLLEKKELIDKKYS